MYEWPNDTTPNGVVRMMLVTGQERDVRRGVLDGKDVAKGLRFEETETEHEVQESAREHVEASTKHRTTAEGEQSSVDMKRLERTGGESFQEMQGHGASATTPRGHIDH